MKIVFLDTSEGEWKIAPDGSEFMLSANGGAMVHAALIGGRIRIAVKGSEKEVDFITENLDWRGVGLDVLPGRVNSLLNRIARDDWEDDWEDYDYVILHVSDWNYQDKYYQMPREMLITFYKTLKEKGLDEAWRWLGDNTDYGLNAEDTKLPIKYGDVNMRYDEYFFDYTEPDASIDEWEIEEEANI